MTYRDGLMISEKEHVNGEPVDVIKKIVTYGRDYYVSSMRYFGYDYDEVLTNLNQTSFTSKNTDKIQVIAFGGNICNSEKSAEGLRILVEDFIKQNSNMQNIQDRINVTGVGYISSPLLSMGELITIEYVNYLTEFAKRVFNLDGTIEDIAKRASNTILFSHCVGSEAINVFLNTLIDALDRKHASIQKIDEILGSMLAINYASYMSDFGMVNTVIPAVNIFQANDTNNDGGRFMSLDDIHKSDRKKIAEVKSRVAKSKVHSLAGEISNWNGVLFWSSGNQNVLNLTFDKLNRGVKLHSPKSLIMKENDGHTKLLEDFSKIFGFWFDEVISGKHDSKTKVPVLKQYISSSGLGKRISSELLNVKAMG